MKKTETKKDVIANDLHALIGSAENQTLSEDRHENIALISKKFEKNFELLHSFYEGLSKGMGPAQARTFAILSYTNRCDPFPIDSSNEINITNIKFLSCFGRLFPRGYVTVLSGETGTGKTNFACYVAREHLKRNKTARLLILDKESDWNQNIVPALHINYGIPIDEINQKVEYIQVRNYTEQKDKILQKIKSLKPNDFILLDPARFIVNKPNDNVEVDRAIQEYQKIVHDRDIYCLFLHHTSMDWRGKSIKQQSKFCEEWVSTPQHATILKEKEEGECIVFIQKSNLTKRNGAIHFSIKSGEFDYKGTLITDKPYIDEVKFEKVSTKDIMKKYFKTEYGIEKTRQLSESSEKIRGIIINHLRTLKDSMNEYEERSKLLKMCQKENFSEMKFNNTIKQLKKEEIIKIEPGAYNKSFYALDNDPKD